MSVVAVSGRCGAGAAACGAHVIVTIVHHKEAGIDSNGLALPSSLTYCFRVWSYLPPSAVNIRVANRTPVIAWWCVGVGDRKAAREKTTERREMFVRRLRACMRVCALSRCGAAQAGAPRARALALCARRCVWRAAAAGVP